MTWRYQAYKHKDGSIAIHERYDISGGISATLRPVLTIDHEPDDSPAREAMRAIENLRAVTGQMVSDVAEHGIEHWPFDDAPPERIDMADRSMFGPDWTVAPTGNGNEHHLFDHRGKVAATGYKGEKMQFIADCINTLAAVTEQRDRLVEAVQRTVGALDRCEANDNASIVDELTEEIENYLRHALAASIKGESESHSNTD